MANRASDAENELREALDQFLVSKGKGPDRQSGNYRRNAGREVERFIEWLEASGVHNFAQLEDEGVGIFREYARKEIVIERDLKPSSAQTYWNYLSAWTGWCVREGLLSRNYGQLTDAREPLPEDDGSSRTKQQSWSDEQRVEFLRYLDRRAHEAIDECGHEAIAEVRDRALGYVLAYTGVRGAEMLRSTNDVRRNGLEWEDVHLEQSYIEVLSKKQEIDERAVPEQAHGALERLKNIVDPNPDWPVFPSLSQATLRRQLRGEVPDEEIDEATTAADLLTCYGSHDVRPPALTTGGARDVLRRLTDEAGVELDDEKHDYLKPHGARRGAGRVLVLEQGADAAAEQLDNSVRVVEDHYSDILAETQADRTGSAFENRE